MLAAAALALGGCGRKHELAGDRIPGHTLTIYSSLPLHGASSFAGQEILNGERLALAERGGRIGAYAVQLKPLDDTVRARGGWDPGQTTVNAHLALADPTTIGYLGDFNSGASAVAIPLLERLGIPDVSPMSTAVGLTTDGPGASPGEPAKYYPTGRRTFVRLAPDDAVQAEFDVRLERSLGCRATVILNDGLFDGYDATGSFGLVARSHRLRVIAIDSFDPSARDYSGLALSVAQTGADCVLVSAAPESHTAHLVTQVAAGMRHATIIATAPLAQPSFADPEQGGVPASLDRQMLITAPAPGMPAYDAGFLGAYASRFGPPGPYAAYGYEAMRLLLAAVADATAAGHKSARRSKVLRALFSDDVRRSVLGPFSVRGDGSTTLAGCSVYLVRHGALVAWFTQRGG